MSSNNFDQPLESLESIDTEDILKRLTESSQKTEAKEEEEDDFIKNIREKSLRKKTERKKIERKGNTSANKENLEKLKEKM